MHVPVAPSTEEHDLGADTLGDDNECVDVARPERWHGMVLRTYAVLASREAI